MISLPQALYAAAALAALWASPASATPGSCSDRNLLVSSPNFSVRGSWAKNVISPVRQFLGIPYAEPPVGEHRFRPPVTKKPWKETLDAASYGYSCMQYDTGAPTVFKEHLPGQRLTVDMSEDCLTLNIWTPPPPKGKHHKNGKKKSKTLLPVMIWIPGGALLSGGAAVPNTNGARLVAEQEDIIVVSMNYRVNIFGFPAAEGLDGSNLNPGLMDQRKAVEWLHNNIAYFGGDPERMTLFGQSAGGSSADIYSYAWFNDPLVVGMIVMSGAVGNRQFATTGSSNFTYVAEQVGCGGLDKDAELACMQTANGTEILEVYNRYNASENGGRTLAFGATVDDQVVPTNWTERRERGLVAQLPMLLGVTDNDFSSLFSPYDGTAPDQEAVDLLTDEIFNCRAAIASRSRRSPPMSLPIWRYRYFGEFPNLNPLPWLGAYHASEIPMIFGTSDLYAPDTDDQKALGRYMRDAWVAFAKDPVEGLKEFGWPLYEDEEGDTLVVLGKEGEREALFEEAGAYDGGCGPDVG